MQTDQINISPQSLGQLNDPRRTIIITLYMTTVVRYIVDAVRSENSEKRELVFDPDQPVRSTGDMSTWYTSKPCEPTKRSHINYAVYDSTWEQFTARELDRNSNVEAWVKNDHLGFEIKYSYRGVIRNYRPDFIVKLNSGTTLILEIKGEETDQSRVKHKFLEEWVRAVNEHGGYGHWDCDISFEPSEAMEIINRYSVN